MSKSANLGITNTLARVYSKMPPGVRSIAHKVRHMPRYVRWYVDPRGRAHAKDVLGPLKGAFAGARCVVIGNGPSLKNTPMHLLRSEITFGLNRIYLMFEELGWSPHFHCCTNRYVLEQFGEEILDCPGLKVVNWRYAPTRDARPDVVAVPPRPSDTQITGDPSRGFGGRTSTVTLLAVDLALFLGFSQIVLIGVDHTFKEKGLGNKAVVSSGPDANHFHPDYFGKDTVWQLPDLPEMDRGYFEARQAAQARGVSIVDATVGGALQVFEKADLESVLAGSLYKSIDDFPTTTREQLPRRRLG